MACHGLPRNALSLVSSLPCRATRTTTVSRTAPKHLHNDPYTLLTSSLTARYFQILARKPRRRLLCSNIQSNSQNTCNPTRCQPCRTFHGGITGGAQDTHKLERSHSAHPSQATTDNRNHGNIPRRRRLLHTASPDLTEAVRTHMRRVPQPVTIVTSSNTSTHPDGHPDGWHGATISSFNTVSLHPAPIISFNIRKISSTYDAIEASGKLWVHFLTQTPSAIDLADRFAQWDKPNPFRSLLLVRRDKDTDTEELNLKVPMIHNERSSTPRRIAFILECEYMKDKTVAIGDHVVLFATVTEVDDKIPNYVFEGRSAFQPPGGPCLVYAEGEYQGVTPLERSSQEGKDA